MLTEKNILNEKYIFQNKTKNVGENNLVLQRCQSLNLATSASAFNLLFWWTYMKKSGFTCTCIWKREYFKSVLV